MGKIKNAFNLLAEVGNAMTERNNEIHEMASMIVKKGYDIDYRDAHEVAAILVDHAEVTWK